MNELLSLWHAHRDTGWPKISGDHEGELMTLDTVISGCVMYFLETEGGLDPQRVEILQTCLRDLNSVLPDVTDEAGPYFERLRQLAGLLLAVNESQ